MIEIGLSENRYAAKDSKPTIAIVGGGFSGAAVALHLNRLIPNRAKIIVFEPRDEIGRGVAYSSTDPSHRINVPTSRMRVFPDDPDHFGRWYASSRYVSSDPEAFVSSGEAFPLRYVFGTYVSEQLASLGQALWHIRSRAIKIERITDGYRVFSSTGEVVDANVLVLAISHPAAPETVALRRLRISSRAVISDPWQPEAFADVHADARLLIVGTGLTMADIVASLDRRGHHGQIVAISRRGQLSRGHPAKPVDPFGDFLLWPSSARELLVRIRKNVAEAEQLGRSWHCVLDQVRIQGNLIWRALPLNERQRLVRHLRPFWDAHRFRVAPQIQKILEHKLSSGQLTVRAASLLEAKDIEGQLQITIKDRRRDQREQITVDRIALAAGPAHDRLFLDDPLLVSMGQSGLAHSDSLGLGIEVDLKGRAINRLRLAEQRLFVVGPLARGTFGDLVGVPDVSCNALRVAIEIERTLQLGRRLLRAER